MKTVINAMKKIHCLFWKKEYIYIIHIYIREYIYIRERKKKEEQNLPRPQHISQRTKHTLPLRCA